MKMRHLQASLALAKIYFTSEHKRQAWLFSLTIITLTFAHVYLLVLLNRWNNTFYGALQEYNTQVMFSSLGEFSLLAGIYILVAVYSFYLQQILELHWRTHLTKVFIEDWLSQRTYYLLQLTNHDTDNPDQRISEDIKLFTNITITLTVGFLRSVGTFVAFVFILWRLSGKTVIPWLNIPLDGYLVYVALIYATLGSYLAHKIGKKLIDLNYLQQQKEANFRFALVRLRENSENIAFYRGENLEQLNFINYFTQVIRNFKKIISKRKQLVWYNSFYGQIAIIFPFLVSMPRYLAREINLGGLMQIASAFGRVQDALSFFVDAYTSIAEWQAVVERLSNFQTDMQAMQNLQQARQINYHQSSQATLQLTNLNIYLPNQIHLLKDLNLELNPGEHLLIKGASGSGKSTLMRTLAGLWLLGSGLIKLPSGQKTMFLPQRTYLPLGSLRQAILYPQTEPVADSLIKLALASCALDYLSEQLDTTADWSHILSLGEQQRIAIARALLLKPQWLFLDEATSALDSKLEAQVYLALQEQIPQLTLLSVAHKPTLDQFHQQLLELRGCGTWQLTKL